METEKGYIKEKFVGNANALENNNVLVDQSETLVPPPLFGTAQAKMEESNDFEKESESTYNLEQSHDNSAEVVISPGLIQKKEETKESEIETAEIQMKTYADAPSDLPPEDGNSNPGSNSPTDPSSNPNKNNNSSPLQKQEGPPMSSQSTNSGLPSELVGKMESTIGHDFSNVNIHTNSSKASDVGALAYTQGTDLHFAPGQFNPGTSAGQELIGHELTHVKQQAQGRVKPTTTASNGMAVNDDKGLEKEADVLGAKAAQLKTEDESHNSNLVSNKMRVNSTLVQMKVAQLDDGNEEQTAPQAELLNEQNVDAAMDWSGFYQEWMSYQEEADNVRNEADRLTRSSSSNETHRLSDQVADLLVAQWDSYRAVESAVSTWQNESGNVEDGGTARTQELQNAASNAEQKYYDLINFVEDVRTFNSKWSLLSSALLFDFFAASGRAAIARTRRLIAELRSIEREIQAIISQAESDVDEAWAQTLINAGLGTGAIVIGVVCPPLGLVAGLGAAGASIVLDRYLGPDSGGMGDLNAAVSGGSTVTGELASAGSSLSRGATAVGGVTLVLGVYFDGQEIDRAYENKLRAYTRVSALDRRYQAALRELNSLRPILENYELAMRLIRGAEAGAADARAQANAIPSYQSPQGGGSPQAIQRKTASNSNSKSLEDTVQLKTESSLEVSDFNSTSTYGIEQEKEVDILDAEANSKSRPSQENTIQKQEDSSLGAQSSKSGLSSELMGKMESTIGHDFSNVNIHTNSSKASEVGALAYTQGSDLHFAPGQFKPDTKAGQELIGHELTHVKQQAEGRVKPTTTASNGMAVNDEKGLEKEADNYGAKAASSSAPLQTKPDITKAVDTSKEIVQKKSNPIQLDEDQDQEVETIPDSAIIRSGSTTITETTQTYNITGRFREISGQLEQEGSVDGEAGDASATSVPSYTYIPINRSSARVEITVEMTKRMPNWTNLESYRQGAENHEDEEHRRYYRQAVDAWEDFYSDLEEHEDAHNRIDRSHFENMHRHLIRKNLTEGDAEVMRIIAAADAENNAYHTEHGASETLRYVQEPYEGRIPSRGSSTEENAQNNEQETSQLKKSNDSSEKGVPLKAKSEVKQLADNKSLSQTNTPQVIQKKEIIQLKKPNNGKSKLPDKAADVNALLSKDFKNLKLGEGRIKQLQDCLDARLELAKLDEQLDKIRGSILSSDARKRERIYKRARKYRSKEIKAIVLSTDKVLSKDFRGAKDELKDIKAFKEALYIKYISEPTYFVLGKGYDPSSIFTSVEWSQYRWKMSHDSGQITFDHGVRPQKFNLAYQKVLLSGSIDALEKMIEIRKQMGGIEPMAEGKKVGETYGHIWNSTINVRSKIGNPKGYTPDEEGKQELNSHFESLQGARAVIVGSDKWSHIYSLESFTVKDLKGEIGDDYGYLLTNGAEVSAQRVRTKDGFELGYGTGKTGTGWRSKQLLNELEQFSIGAIIGDFSEDPTATETVGQIAMGAVPIAGQIADARDTAAAISKVWSSGGKDGKLQLTFAIIGWVPLLGDGIKAAWKAGGKKVATKFVVESVQKNVDMLTKRLGKEIAYNPSEWARKFGLDEAASSKMGKAIDDALESGSKEAIDKLGKELIETYNKHGKNPFVLINRAGGSWKSAIKILDKVKDGTKVANELEAYRIAQFDAMVSHVGKTSKKYGPDVSIGGRPKFERTGTPSYKSDYDGSFLGPNASFFKERAEEYMSAKFGANWRTTFDADIFTDPSRLHLYADATKGLSGGAASAIEKRVVKDAELNVLAKMLNSGVAPEVVKKKADDLGVDLAEVTARQSELKDISAGYLAGLLNKGHPEDAVKKQANDMGVDFQKVLEKQKSNSGAFRELELKLDSLHGKFLNEKNPAKRAAIAEEMAKIQGRINASIPGPYMTPGGVLKNTTQRDKALRKLLTGAEFTPSMAYMQVLDDYYMLVTALPANKVFNEKSAKSFAKYADRLMITAGRFGAVDAGTASVRAQFDEIFGILQRARIEGAKPDLSKIQGVLKTNSSILQQQINNIEIALKKTSSKYISELADKSKKTTEKNFISKTMTYLSNSRKSLAGMASLQLTKNYADKKQSQKDIDKENEKVGQKKEMSNSSEMDNSSINSGAQRTQNLPIPSHVKIHQNSSKAREVNALAFAQGSDIHFAPGQFKPDSRAGQELIGHELAHVKQQKEGRVKPTSHTKGIPINEDKGLENEADDYGRSFAAQNTLQAKMTPQNTSLNSSSLSNAVIQKHGDGSEEHDEEKTPLEHVFSFLEESSDLNDYAEKNGISMQEVTTAINNASMGSFNDNLKTATAYLVAKAAGHPAANYILNGQVKVDCLSKDEMVDKTGVAADGFYANMTSADGKIIADTLYLRNHIVITELSSRGLIIHELTHAQDDANAPLLEGEDSTTIPQYDFEANGYRSQAKYIMDQIHDADENTALSHVDEIVKVIKGGDGMIFVYSFYLEAQKNKAKYSPILIKILADPFPNVSSEKVLENLDLDASKIEEELLDALAAHPMYGGIENKNIRIDGLKEHVVQPRMKSEPQSTESKSQNQLTPNLPDSVNIHQNSSKASNLGALAFAQGSDIHFAPGQFKPDTRAGQELIGHELAHVQQQKEGRVKATKSANGTPINDDKGLEKEADDFGISFANSLKNSPPSGNQQQSVQQFKLKTSNKTDKTESTVSTKPFAIQTKQSESNGSNQVADFGKEYAGHLRPSKVEESKEKAFKIN